MAELHKHKIIFKGTIEISQGDIKERVPIKIVSSNEDGNFIQSVQFFQPNSRGLEPKKFKNRLIYYAKSMGQYLTNLMNGDDV
jgi:hypothetical protein